MKERKNKMLDKNTLQKTIKDRVTRTRGNPSAPEVYAVSVPLVAPFSYSC